MNKQLRTLIAFSVAGGSLMTALPVFGGDLNPIHVTVPFAFTAAKTNLPAGDYTVSEENSHLVMLKGSHGSAILLGTAGQEDNEKSGLSFERTQNRYFLKAVHAIGRPSSVLPIMNPGSER